MAFFYVARNKEYGILPNMNVRKKIRVDLDNYFFPLFRKAAIILVNRAFPFPKHYLPYYHIHYVFKGEETWTLQDGSIMRIKGGHIGILQPNILHGCGYGVMSPATILSLSPASNAPRSVPLFSRQETDRLMHTFRQAGNRIVTAPPELESLFRTLYSTTKDSKRKTKSAFYKTKVRLIMAQIVLCISDALSSPPKAAFNRKIEKAKRLIEQRLNIDIRTSEIAGQVGMKPAHFHNLFRKLTGRTPADYHLWLRCDHSREILTGTSTPIVEIANNLDFSSSQHYSACFKKYFAITPSEYRNTVKEKSKVIDQI